MKNKYKEKDLQKDILSWLRLNQYLAIKYPSIGTYNSKTQKYIPMPICGVSDILFWGNGRFGAIECKMKYNRVSLNQEKFLEEMKEKGGIDIVAYSLDEVINILKVIK